MPSKLKKVVRSRIAKTGERWAVAKMRVRECQGAFLPGHTEEAIDQSADATIRMSPPRKEA